MLRLYKTKKQAAADEIERLGKVCLLKESEILDLNENITSLKTYSSEFKGKAEEEIAHAKNCMAENLAVIKRQDKLIVDLMQQNQVTDIQILKIREDCQKRTRETATLDIKNREMQEKRDIMESQFDTMKDKITKYHNFQKAYQNQLNQEKRVYE